jgi:hypothetical protein
MTNVPQTAGVKSYVLYGEETTYNTAATADKHFGLSTNIDINLKNNLKSNRGFKGSTTGGRDALSFTAGKAELDATIDFDLNDDAFLEYVLGDLTGSVYSGTDMPASITIVKAIDNVTTDRDNVLSGCVIDTCSIKGAEGEPVTCSLGVKIGNSDYDDTLTANTALTNKAPYTFSESTFELPNSTAITNIVTDFDVSIANNFELHYGNSRTAVAYTPGAREYRVKLSTKYVDDALLNKALGGTTVATDTPLVNATFEIVLTRPDNDTLTLLFTLAPIDSYSLKAQLNSAIEESIELVCSSLTITKA